MSLRRLCSCIRSGAPLSAQLLAKLENDPSMCPSVKKRVAMFAKGDKRISAKKLLRDLKGSNIRGYVGGDTPEVVYKFGVDSPAAPVFKFGVDSPATQQSPSPIRFMINPGSKNAKFFTTGLTDVSLSISNSYRPSNTNVYCSVNEQTQCNKRYTASVLIGSGSYADVHRIDGSNSLCIKLFKNFEYSTSPQVCISKFCASCLDYIKEGNTTIPYNGGDIDATSLWFKNDQTNRIGYVVQLMAGSLTDLFNRHFASTRTVDIEDFAGTRTVDIKAIHDAIRAQVDHGLTFIHADVKLDNILYEYGQGDSIRTKLHDFDTVYVYDDSKLLHAGAQPISITPLCAHPFLVLFTKCVLSSTTDAALISALAASSIGHLDRWKFVVAFVTSKHKDTSVIRRILTSILRWFPERYDEIVLDKLNQDHQGSWLKTMLKKFDLYSYGASLIVYGWSHAGLKDDDRRLMVEMGEDVIRDVFKDTGFVADRVAGTRSPAIEGGAGMPGISVLENHHQAITRASRAPTGRAAGRLTGLPAFSRLPTPRGTRRFSPEGQSREGPSFSAAAIHPDRTVSRRPLGANVQASRLGSVRNDAPPFEDNSLYELLNKKLYIGTSSSEPEPDAAASANLWSAERLSIDAHYKALFERNDVTDHEGKFLLGGCRGTPGRDPPSNKSSRPKSGKD